VHFFRNQSRESGAFVALLLRGTACNRDAIGARVEVHRAGRPTLVSTLRAGEGYVAQSSRWMHFGLGDGGRIERVVVRWPAPHREGVAAVEEFAGAAHARFVLVQGSGKPQRWSEPARKIALAASKPAAHKPSERARIVLAARVPMPRLTMTAPDGQQGEITGVIHKPMLINLWATWCQPCVTELTARGSTTSVKSEWLWISMNPGVTYKPWASRTGTPSGAGIGATSTIRPSRTNTSARAGGAPVPSTTVPPVMMNSMPRSDRH
jgi:hypothetical protein